MSSKARSTGFSLLELLIVVAIILAVSAIGLPNLARAIRGYKIQGAAKLVGGDIMKARGKAIMSNTTAGVTFAVLDQDSYRYVQEDLWDPSTGQPKQAGDLPLSAIQDLPQGVVFVPGGTTSLLRFRALGSFCVPGVTPCAAITAGFVCPSPDKERRCNAGASAKYIFVDGPTTGGETATGGYFVQVRESTTGLMRRIHIGPGGRIRVARGQVD